MPIVRAIDVGFGVTKYVLREPRVPFDGECCAVLGRALQQGTSDGLQLVIVQPCRAPWSGHRSKSIDAAFIEHCLPRVRGLPRHTDGVCGLRRRLARQ